MVPLTSIDADLRFLVVAVLKQVEKAWQVLDDPSERSREGIMRGDDYVDLLKSRIENRCFASLTETATSRADHTNWVKAVTVITSNLERIADFAVNLSRQTQYLTEPTFMRRFDYRPMFTDILDAVGLIVEAIGKRDSALAYRICRAESGVDRVYQEMFARILEELSAAGSARNLVTSLFIFHYLERMGDALLNIGEAILSVVFGERLKIRQYSVLHAAVAGQDEGAQLTDVGFEPIWGTRSGCRLGRVWDKGNDPRAEEAIFKDGSPEKLLREKDNIDRWAALMPGLPPKVLQATREGNEATLMLQFLGGRTLQEILLGGDSRVLDAAAQQVEETLLKVWRATMRFGPVNADFLGQWSARAEDVFRLHPRFRTPRMRIGGLTVASFSELLSAASVANAELSAPFSVLVHGDLNVDNVIYDAGARELHLIDLHRSKESDYVQDVSVLLASAFRLPVLDAARRQRIDAVVLRFSEFARRFSATQTDETFDARLALAMARSFSTSTRFELHGPAAGDMQLRAVYLLERLVVHAPQPWTAFSFPTHVLLH